MKKRNKYSHLHVNGVILEKKKHTQTRYAYYDSEGMTVGGWIKSGELVIFLEHDGLVSKCFYNNNIVKIRTNQLTSYRWRLF